MQTRFADLGIPAEIQTTLEKRGFTHPFEIQITTIPDALAGKDICGRAATGSGKTLAFGIPLVAGVGKGRSGSPRALVLAPTRELAEQIQRELEPLARARGRSIMSIYGGVGYEPQRRALRKGVDIVVACPGRLADLIKQGDVRLGDVDFVVLDEADRMADMGFLPEVRRLLDQTAPNRQTLLFSATLDGDVDVLTRQYQRDPVYHHVGELEPDITLAQHHFWRLEAHDRLRTTVDVIGASGQTIVFSRTRRGADRIARQLANAGVSAAPIHGSRSQGQRNRALNDFSAGRVKALVATDVAARGIHVDDVACVLHFDPPEDEKTYMHRSGRTARAGASGVVVTFVLEDTLADIETMLAALGLGVQIVAPAPDRLFSPEGKPLEAPKGPVRQPRSNGASASKSGGRRRGGRKPGGATGGQRQNGHGNGARSGAPSSRPGGGNRRRQSGARPQTSPRATERV